MIIFQVPISHKIHFKLVFNVFFSYPVPDISVLVFPYLSIASVSSLSLKLITLSYFQALSFLSPPIFSYSLSFAVRFSRKSNLSLPLSFQDTEFVFLASICSHLKLCHTHLSKRFLKNTYRGYNI